MPCNVVQAMAMMATAAMAMILIIVVQVVHVATASACIAAARRFGAGVEWGPPRNGCRHPLLGGSRCCQEPAASRLVIVIIVYAVTRTVQTFVGRCPLETMAQRLLVQILPVIRPIVFDNPKIAVSTVRRATAASTTVRARPLPGPETAPSSLGGYNTCTRARMLQMLLLLLLLLLHTGMIPPDSWTRAV